MSLASGWPTGTLVNVSLTVGTRERKKLNDSKKFSKYLALLLSFLFEYKKYAIAITIMINSEKTCPALKPPCFEIPNAVIEVTSVA
jgi:Na+-driven multidrug efflux pump